MNNQGVCIVHEQAISQSGLVDKDCLVKAGYSVRVSGNCLPDLIISRAGTTAAYLLVSSQVVLSGSDIWNRFLGKLSIICYPHSSSLCQRAIEMFHALTTPEDELRVQRLKAVMSSAAIDQVLTSMPELRLNSHHASALRVLGSLQTLAVSSAEAIVECTDLDHAQAVKLVQAFNVPMS